MSTLLHIDSSPMGEGSISRHLTHEFVRQWRAANPRGKVIERDLTCVDIPPIDAAWIGANLTPKEARTAQQDEMLALSTVSTHEVLEADEYAIGVPMHNWGPSASFKLWADQIVRFGETVVTTGGAMKGTLGKKRITFFLAAGRNYGAATGGPTNHLEPWLRTFFGSLGVSLMHFVFADGTSAVKYGKLDQAEYLAPRLAEVRSIFAE